MKTHRWRDVQKRVRTPEQIKASDDAAEKAIVEMNLAEMRKLVGKTQAEVGAALEKAQGEVSKIEGRKDLLLSTLRAYVEALGGHIEVRAVFDDKTVQLKGL
jgi:hypothetical protein